MKSERREGLANGPDPRKERPLLGGTAIWPVEGRGQQQERMRRIGVIQGLAANDSEGQDRFDAFFHALQQLGWTDGRNIQIVHRFTDGDGERARAYAAELVALAPDRTVPVVFVGAADPVGAGFVDSLAHPGGNATGFTSYEYSMSSKWLELLNCLGSVRVLRIDQNGNDGRFGIQQSEQLATCRLLAR